MHDGVYVHANKRVFTVLIPTHQYKGGRPSYDDIPTLKRRKAIDEVLKDTKISLEILWTV